MTSHSNNSISLPFKTRLQLSLLNLATYAVTRHDGTINRRLMNLFDRRLPSNPIPRNGVSTHDVTINPATNLWFRLFIPHTKNSTLSLPVVVFFHGGGFSLLSAASFSYDAVCRRFSRKLNAVVCSVDYRLSPEHKFPAQYDDAFAALQFLDKHVDQIPSWPENADVSKCFIAGDSAGGNLAHHVTVMACGAHFSNLRVIGHVSIQPFFGGKERAESEVRLEGGPIVTLARTQWLWRAFLPDGLDLDHWAVNVSGPNAVDVSGLGNYPPTIVFVGGLDPLRDWQIRYYEWLKRAGKELKLVEYSKAIHAFYVFPELPDSSLLFDEVKDFIDKQRSKVR